MPETQPFPESPGFASNRLSSSDIPGGLNQRREGIIDVQKVLDNLKDFCENWSTEDEM
jgi:hypothetical protein